MLCSDIDRFPNRPTCFREFSIWLPEIDSVVWRFFQFKLEALFQAQKGGKASISFPVSLSHSEIDGYSISGQGSSSSFCSSSSSSSSCLSSWFSSSWPKFFICAIRLPCLHVEAPPRSRSFVSVARSIRGETLYSHFSSRPARRFSICSSPIAVSFISSMMWAVCSPIVAPFVDSIREISARKVGRS